MRLTLEQQSALRAALRRSFGASARLWVFGSRVDDRARGGDYDFLVQTEDADADRLVDAKLGFLAELHATPAFEDEKLDVVLFSPALDPQPRPIHRVALAQGVELT
jgi:predicted nucleotidyltransferase